jgi:hypothetical protein
MHSCVRMVGGIEHRHDLRTVTQSDVESSAASNSALGGGVPASVRSRQHSKYPTSFQPRDDMTLELDVAFLSLLALAL